MKKKIVILLIFALVFTSVLSFSTFEGKTVEAAASFQKVNFVSAVVTAQQLNVRQGASTKYPVVCVLNKGQTVKVFGKIGDWYAVYDPTKGCVGAVSSYYLKTSGTTTAKKATPAPTPKTVPKATPKVVPTPKPAAVPTGISQDEQTLLNLVNGVRSDAGAGALSFDMDLMKCARLKAKDMVDNNYFSHQSPTYGSPFDMMKQFGITFSTAGENIAGNQSVNAAFNAWMGSAGHKANILNSSFNLTGVGIVDSPTYGKIFVQQLIGR
jgi:uncharacterized YkwD family protein